MAVSIDDRGMAEGKIRSLCVVLPCVLIACCLIACSQDQPEIELVPTRTPRPTVVIFPPTVAPTVTPTPLPVLCPNSTERNYFERLSEHTEGIQDGNETVMELSQDMLDNPLLYLSSQWTKEVVGGLARMQVHADYLGSLNPLSSSLSHVDRLAKQVSQETLLAVDYLAQSLDSLDERDIERASKQFQEASTRVRRMNQAIATFCD